MIRWVTVPPRPVRTHLFRPNEPLFRHHCRKIALALKDLYRQAVRRVPGDMAVEEPGTRVVRLKSDDDEAARCDQRCVAARRIGECEIRNVYLAAVRALGEEREVVPV